MSQAFVHARDRVVTEKSRITPTLERMIEMARCEVCGNEYDKAFSTPDTHAPPTLTVTLAG